MFILRRQPQNNQKANDPLDQDEKVKELRAALGPLSGRSLQYCTDSCLRRYLEARNWNLEKAKKMLEETLEWRASFKPEEIRWHEVAHVGTKGLISRANFHDRLGRTVVIVRPGVVGKVTNDNFRYLVYMLENAVLNLGEGQDQMSWLLDFSGWSFSTNIPIKMARDSLNVLQNHYPERLSIAIIYNPPRIFEPFWKAISYFLDPNTAKKVQFVYPKNKDSVERMKSLFDTDNLPQEFGGKARMQYDHEEYTRWMEEDDVKTAKFWGSTRRLTQIASGTGCMSPSLSDTRTSTCHIPSS